MSELQKIRINLKAYDHALLDQSASKIVEAAKKTGLPVEKIGAFFISPCAAKLSDVRNPIGIEKSSVDGVIAIKDGRYCIDNQLAEAIEI